MHGSLFTSMEVPHTAERTSIEVKGEQCMRGHLIVCVGALRGKGEPCSLEIGVGDRGGMSYIFEMGIPL